MTDRIEISTLVRTEMSVAFWIDPQNWARMSEDDRRELISGYIDDAAMYFDDNVIYLNTCSVSAAVTGPVKDAIDLNQIQIYDPKGEFVDKRAHLERLGWIVGDRDPRLDTDFIGRFMCAEPYTDDQLPTRDGANGPWCIVGDDLQKLIDEAYQFVTDLDDAS